MLIDRQNITNFIPQRAPFVMVDTLVDATEAGFSSTFEVRSDNLFLDESNELSESALVENVAQTCAAGFGYLNSLKEGGEVQLGFIGAVSKLTVSRLPEPGAQLSTKIEIISAFDTIHLVEGSVYSNEALLINCQLKIVLG